MERDTPHRALLSDADVTVLNHVQSITVALCNVDVTVLNHVQSVMAVLSDADVIMLNHVQPVTAVLPDVIIIIIIIIDRFYIALFSALVQTHRARM